MYSFITSKKMFFFLPGENHSEKRKKKSRGGSSAKATVLVGIARRRFLCVIRSPTYLALLPEVSPQIGIRLKIHLEVLTWKGGKFT